MPVQSQLPPVVRFGVFEIDVRAGELRKSGVKIKLQEQPFQVLCMLVERPGEVVTREELRNRLWPADTFVDFDHGVNAAIKRLRDTLGESAERPVYIETLARRGYRFIAPVDGLPDRAGAAGVEPQEGPKPIFRWPWAAIALLLPIAIGLVMWALWRYPSRHTEYIERKLTANSSENPVSSAAISPDGRFLVYSDGTGLYQKLIQHWRNSLGAPASELLCAAWITGFRTELTCSSLALRRPRGRACGVFRCLGAHPVS